MLEGKVLVAQGGGPTAVFNESLVGAVIESRKFASVQRVYGAHHGIRGIIDEAGGSPFWDGLAGRFFGMSFQEADYFNAIHGNQFIADLMPKHPIYTAMLSESARSVIGLPHPSGRAAMRMLENEGFAYEGYVDIFDGGPSMVARTDQVTTVRDAAELRVKESDRISAFAGEVRRMGIVITELPDGFRLSGPQQITAAAVDSHSDHRLAMSLIVAALLADGESTVQRADAVQESFPGFTRALRVLGTEVH